jgi:hypothetical protein
MYVEFGDDNRFKKRVTKNLKKTFAEDQGFAPSLGTTKPDAKAFDNLEDALENVETKGQLVLDQIDRNKILRASNPTSFEAPQGVTSFYTAVKSAISALKKTDFKGLPRTDIAGLESYLERLKDLGIESEFQALLSIFNTKPPPAVIQQRQADNVIVRQMRRDIQALTEQRTRTQGDLIAETQRAKPLLARERQRFEDEIKAITFEIENLQRILNELEKAQSEGVSARTTKKERADIIQSDMFQLIPLYNVLLNSLDNGLKSYRSGVSGKNVIVGSGCYTIGMGGQDYLPRRYL